jgi:hypothetical protein
MTRADPPRRASRALILTAACALWGGAAQAQTSQEFQGRLSVLPIDFATAPSMSGSGEAHATLTGPTLVITGDFEGLSSPATAAHVHQAPRARRGPVAFTLDVVAGRSGTLAGTFTLDAAARDALRGGNYYVQIHTENNRGGELRGWLLPPRP